MDATKEQIGMEVRSESAASPNGTKAGDNKLSTMKAMVYTSYGPPEEVLTLREIEIPVPKADEVLVRVHASSVGSWDWLSLNGQPYLMRPMFGFRSPNRTIPGADVAGTVEAVGEEVKLFRPGDEVYGELSNGGGYAEYVCVPERNIGIKPANQSFEQAASMPIAGLTALQGLRDKGEVVPGKSVLINGASGGVGTFAVQIAKALGAEVTAVCSTRNVELVRSLGADHVIDYTQEDFTQGTRRHDVIMDNVGNHALSANRGALKPDGIYVPSFGRLDRKWVGPLVQLIGMLVVAPFASQKLVSWVQTTDTEHLDDLRELAESGAVTPVIEREYPLADAVKALRHQGNGHAQGKTVVTVA